MEEHGIVVKEVTGQKRNRFYSYPEYTRIMNKGTELPSKMVEPWWNIMP